MGVFRLDKAIENEKLDLEMAIAQLKEAKEHLSKSLKRLKTFSLQEIMMKQMMQSKNS